MVFWAAEYVPEVVARLEYLAQALMIRDAFESQLLKGVFELQTCVPIAEHALHALRHYAIQGQIHSTREQLDFGDGFGDSFGGLRSKSLWL